MFMVVDKSHFLLSQASILSPTVEMNMMPQVYIDAANLEKKLRDEL